jgi:hypothetical protein
MHLKTLAISCAIFETDHGKDHAVAASPPATEVLSIGTDPRRHVQVYTGETVI